MKAEVAKGYGMESGALGAEPAATGVPQVVGAERARRSEVEIVQPLAAVSIIAATPVGATW